MNKQVEHNTTLITSGKYRGATILTPGMGSHPMGSREKIALFNMIQGFLPEATVLDAYAGSGALGLEALSRGATFVLFVDNSTKAAEIIRKNLVKFGLYKTRGEVLCKNVRKEAATTTSRFSLVFADPPYDKYQPEMITELARLVADDGLLIASTPIEPPEVAGFKLIKTRKYARAHISIYSKNVS